MPINSRSIIKGRWYCMWNNGKVKAFTLLEALVALLVLSGGVLVFQGLTKLLHAELDYQAHQKQEEWIHFSSNNCRWNWTGVILKSSGQSYLLGSGSKPIAYWPI